MKYTWRFRLTSLALSALLISAAGCGPEEDAPALPPASSMDMALGTFPTTAEASALSAMVDTESMAHYDAAKLRVGLLNLAVALGLLAPVAVFSQAINTTPSFEGGVWTWSFDASYRIFLQEVPYSATLTGSFENQARTGETLNLEMRVDCAECETPLEDFLWYSGSFKTDGSSGNWQFFHPEITQSDNRFVEISYVVTDETHKTLTFSVNRTDGHASAGDSIVYDRDGVTSSIVVQDASDSLTWETGWDDTLAGYLEVPVYNNGDRACWGPDLHNVECK